jgi:RAB protein geranylgeranyltransferase component A
MQAEVTKICGLCRTEIPLICFSINRKSRDGFHAWCKTCCRKVERERYEIIKKDRIAEVREWQKNNLKKVSEYKKNWRAKQEPDSPTKDSV